MKKLYRSKENRIFAGVVGGLGEYFSVDPVALRMGWIFILVFTGFAPGIVAYIISIFIIPERK
ncbi:MAG: PspC domain-containing protein [Patescibacteria group bacterium]|nr:PspC domain-containing protein [Patescibacteria group bacterium]